MTCVICRHGTTAPGAATVVLERNGSVVVFRDVPADVCANCGEYYLEDDIAGALLERAEAIIQGGVEVAVERYAA